MKIAAEHAELQVPLETLLATVAAPFQSVARLKGVDGGFDSRVVLPCATKLDGRILLLLCRKVNARHRQAWAGDDLCQLCLDLRGMEAAGQAAMPRRGGKHASNAGQSIGWPGAGHSRKVHGARGVRDVAGSFTRPPRKEMLRHAEAGWG